MPYKEQAEAMLAAPHDDHEIVAPDGTVYRWSDGVLRYKEGDNFWRVNEGWGILRRDEDDGEFRDDEAGNLGAIIVMLAAIESGVNLASDLKCDWMYTDGRWEYE